MVSVETKKKVYGQVLSLLQIAAASINCVLLADFLSLSDTFDEHSLLRHQDVDHSSAASKEHSTNRSRIMSNVSYAPPEYVKKAITYV